MQRVRKAKKRSDPNDPQKDQVYDWEIAHEAWNVCSLDIDQCNLIVQAALKLYDCEPVEVYQGPSNHYSYNIPSSRVITMQGPSRRGRGGMNKATVLHEVAHQIAYDQHGEAIQDHGPTWLSIYRELLLAAGVMTEREFKLTARKFGLVWRRAR